MYIPAPLPAPVYALHPVLRHAPRLQRKRPTLHVALAQYVTVRNERGREMLDLVRQRLIVTPTSSSGDRKPFVLQTVQSDDE